ncbi:lantibiotic dehydratase family protein (plasmid) [Embleya sp. NBC_00888]|uniref:lantibiotic dehydratase n=1 Tax=Embleya sp. NBC_00888 TaxID=2975960 RepID=UPI002F90D5DF|nr:lantibiotic dehydratase family protein [Embleya sp. NBC_00888]
MIGNTPDPESSLRADTAPPGGARETGADRVPYSATDGAAALHRRVREVPYTADAFARFFGGDEEPAHTSTASAFTPPYACAGPFLLRTSIIGPVELLPWPDPADDTPDGVRRCLAWTRAAWHLAALAAAVRHASPALADALDTLNNENEPEHEPAPDTVRKCMLSLAKYVLRARGRATPFGLFAGVAEGRFAENASLRTGVEHRAVARAEGAWTCALITDLESTPEVRARLRVQCNSAAVVRGDRWVLPWQPRSVGARSTTVHEVSVALTKPVRTLRALARAPISHAALTAELAYHHPDLGPDGARSTVDTLLADRLLVTDLHPPATETDALGHILHALDRRRPDTPPPDGAGIAELRAIYDAMADHNRTPAASGSRARAALTRRMDKVLPNVVAQPLSVDTRADVDATLPHAIATDIERLASVLARIGPRPHGSPAWRAYSDRFSRTYGTRTAVPLPDLIDAATGIGLPDEFHGTPPTARPPLTDRDRTLLKLASAAVARGEDLVLDDATIDLLAPDDPRLVRVPPHLELLLDVHAPTLAAIDAGEYTLTLRGVSREMGAYAGGRFTALLDVDGDLLATLSNVPTLIDGADSAHVSFPPLNPAATHLGRAPRLSTTVISLAEHRTPDPDTLTPADLAVFSDGTRLHLIRRDRSQILEARTPHTVQLECHTPAVARFIGELVRGQCADPTGDARRIAAFDWGAAAGLPVLPAIRYRRTVVAPPRWLPPLAELPGPEADMKAWTKAFTAWRTETGVPNRVRLARYDLDLTLDLTEPAHLALARAELDRPMIGRVALLGAPPLDAHGWSQGRPVEIVVPMHTTQPPLPAPPLTRIRVTDRDDARLPGASTHLRAHLTGTHRTLDTTTHLTTLATALEHPWWITPDHDVDGALDLVVRLPHPDAFAPTASRIAAWAHHLREDGTLRDLAFHPHRPDTGPWGDGTLRQAAEDVHAADTAAHLHQSTTLHEADPRVVAAANIVDIVIGFHGDTNAGLAHLAARPRTSHPRPVPRGLAVQAARLIDPASDWAHLRRLSGGPALIDNAFPARRAALHTYRTVLDAEPHAGPDLDTALDAFLRAHLARDARIPDDPAPHADVMRLARATALDPRRNPTGP